MLHEFLQKNRTEILALTEMKTRELAGAGPSSEQLERGLPIFYIQLMSVLRLNRGARPTMDKELMAQAAREANEPAMAAAAGRHDEVELAISAANGSTGQMLERGLLRLDELIERSLTEVRLSADPEIHVESAHLLQLVDQIALTAKVEAQRRNQTLEIQIDPALKIEADQQLIHSAISNLIQNALKYTRSGGRIQVRGNLVGRNVVVEVEDQCGGLKPGAEAGLFKPFEQFNDDRKGLGIGLTIARRAIALNHGTVECQNLPGTGCIFRISMPAPAAETATFRQGAACGELTT